MPSAAETETVSKAKLNELSPLPELPALQRTGLILEPAEPAEESSAEGIAAHVQMIVLALGEQRDAATLLALEREQTIAALQARIASLQQEHQTELTAAKLIAAGKAEEPSREAVERTVAAVASDGWAFLAGGFRAIALAATDGYDLTTDVANAALAAAALEQELRTRRATVPAIPLTPEDARRARLLDRALLAVSACALYISGVDSTAHGQVAK